MERARGKLHPIEMGGKTMNRALHPETGIRPRDTQLILPAAGAGKRLGSNRAKALVDVAGMPLVVRTLERFLPLALVDRAVLLAPPGREKAFEDVLARAFPSCDLRVAPGGDTRQTSVAKGLDRLAETTEIVVIHDAARPFVTEDSIRAAIEAARRHGAATVAIPATDTVLEADEEQFLAATPDRRRLWLCQTPQAFQVPVIRKAHELARAEGFVGTDDASLVRRIGGRVKLVSGTVLNFKVTTPTDLAMAKHVVQEKLI